MTTAALIALVVSLVFAATAPGLGRRLPPAAATRALVAGSLVVTGSTIFVLAVVAFTWIGQLPEVAALGSWSSTVLHHDSPIPPGAAIASALLLPVLGAQAIRVIVRRCRALFEVHRSCRHLPADRSLVLVRRPARRLHHPRAPRSDRGHHRPARCPRTRSTRCGGGINDRL